MVKYFSFCTKGTPYEDEVFDFVDSFKTFELGVTVVKVDSQGSWIKNVNLKPKVCLRMLDAADTPIVYTDIDSRLLREPTLFNELEGYDLGVHYFKGIRAPRRELLSGTLYFGKTPAARELLVQWDKECEENQDDWDQRSLNRVVLRSPELRIYELPPEYCKIFDFMEYVKQPVIEHYQKSRKYRQLIYS